MNNTVNKKYSKSDKCYITTKNFITNKKNKYYKNLKKVKDSCSNNPNKSYQKYDGYHEACGYSTSVLRNHSKETTISYYRGKDCLSKLCKELREKATELFNTEKLPMIPLTHEQYSK